MTQTAQAPGADRPVGTLAMIARVAYLTLAAGLLLGVTLQVLFAGMAVLVDAGYWPLHSLSGHMVQPLTFLLLLVGLLTRLRWWVHLLNLLLVVLYIMQFIFLYVLPEAGFPLLRALHAVNALALSWLALLLIRTVWRALRPGWRVPGLGVAILGSALLAVVIALAGRGTGALAAQPAAVPTALPAGNPQAGQALFQQQCAACHATDRTVKVGPGMAGLFQPGGPQLPPGVDYGGKLPNGQPIADLSVAAWIVQGGRGQIGVMPARQLTPQQLADLIAYLRTL